MFMTGMEIENRVAYGTFGAGMEIENRVAYGTLGKGRAGATRRKCHTPFGVRIENRVAYGTFEAQGVIWHFGRGGRIVE